MFKLILIHFAGIALFCMGYFRIKHEYPDFNDTPSTNNKPSKVVFVLIDALRSDLFLNGNFTFYNHMRDNHRDNFLFFNSTATSPTATMLNIKSLMVGNYPSFIQFSLNTAPAAVSEDNVIKQALKHNKTVAQMGDDTWIKLFPNSFTQSHGVDSFDVHDIDSNDNVVQKYLVDYIHSGKYDLIIGHLLGLDHTGHLFNDSNIYLWNKQRQYSKLLEEVYEAIDDNTYLFVVSDHGMTRRGNHGGNSESELSSICFIARKWKPFPRKSAWNINRYIDQVDIAPTLAYLLGVSLPYSNIGLLLPEVTEKYGDTCAENKYQLWNYISRINMDSHKYSQYYQQWQKRLNSGDCLQQRDTLLEIQRVNKSLTQEYDWQFMIVGVLVLISSAVNLLISILQRSFNAQHQEAGYFLLYAPESLFLAPLIFVIILGSQEAAYKLIGGYLFILNIKRGVLNGINKAVFNKLHLYFTQSNKHRPVQTFRLSLLIFNFFFQIAQYLLSFTKQYNPNISVFVILWTSLVILFVVQFDLIARFWKKALLLLLLMFSAEQFNFITPGISEPKLAFQLAMYQQILNLFILKYALPFAFLAYKLWNLSLNAPKTANLILVIQTAFAGLYIVGDFYSFSQMSIIQQRIPITLYISSLIVAGYYRNQVFIYPIILILSGPTGPFQHFAYLMCVEIVYDITKPLSIAQLRPLIRGGCVSTLTLYFWFCLGHRFQFSNINFANAFIGFGYYQPYVSAIVLAINIFGIFLVQNLLFEICSLEDRKLTQYCLQLFYFVHIFFQFLHNLMNLYSVQILFYAQKLIYDILIVLITSLFI